MPRATFISKKFEPRLFAFSLFPFALKKTFISKSPEATAQLGEQWGREAKAGWVIGLSGELGAGKTQLVKGLARGLNIHGRVHSPTFALVNEYTGGRLPLFHLDLYRLESRQQISTAGLEEFLFQVRGVTVVEWFERWLSGEAMVKPGEFSFLRRVTIETLNEQQRRIEYEDFGA